jgi:hypothetical protein
MANSVSHIDSTAVAPRLIVLDPALVNKPIDHHWSCWQELAQIGRELKQPIFTYASHNFQLGTKDAVFPFFKTDTYLGDPAIQNWLNSPWEIRDEYKSLNIPADARVLMHTASPWHLDAIAWKLKEQRNFSISIGSILPSKFWSKDPSILITLDGRLRESFAFLREANMLLYSETGEYNYYSSDSINLPMLLQPASQESLTAAIRLRQKSVPPHDRIKFGFFGQPKKSKGFRFATDLAINLPHTQTHGSEIHFFLPPGYEESIKSLNRPDKIIGTSEFRSNIKLLTDMASVDVILCFYDPAIYSNQMSGLVADAILLGKPVLVTAGTQLERFVNMVAPGAAIHAEYSFDGLKKAIEMSSILWQTAQQQALNSARVVSELKSGDRFFKIVFGLDA